ncbi:polyisoprenoid-binding protein [Chryseobacterium flavum]|uniref:Polyisoprenoid-binding protein n=1 Tax=Chryseobacterium flavum TaxID=415851 RepID=A0A3D9CPC0_9FLAO|nr:YceI family protein [Chryseobacterium flavum]REC67600.1 polyisoprenoid-binding protein [Chryseobacterium flavum]
MKKVLLSFVFVLFSLVSFAQGTWAIDPMHSSVNFNIKHMGISFVQGRFDKFSGTVTTKSSNLENAAFDVTVESETVNTGVEMRDKHLKGDDFFAAGTYPSILLGGATISKDKNGLYMLKAKLTIKDVQKEVLVPVTFGGITKNKDGKEVMGLQAKFTINRLDYNIKYDPTGTGIAKDVDVSVYLELVKQ